MAKVPLQDMSDKGYDKMPEWSGYILSELKDFARAATDQIEKKLDLADIQPLIDMVERQENPDLVATVMMLTERVEDLADLRENLMLIASQLDKYAVKDEVIESLTYLAEQADQHKIYTTTTSITAAEMLTLNASPKTLVAAPGTGKYIEVMRAEFLMTYGTAAYTSVDATKDLSVDYTSAGQVLQIDSVGMLDQTTDQRRVAHHTNTHLVGENEAVTIKALSGEVLTGDSELKVKVEYRIAELLT